MMLSSLSRLANNGIKESYIVKPAALILMIDYYSFPLNN